MLATLTVRDFQSPGIAKCVSEGNKMIQNGHWKKAEKMLSVQLDKVKNSLDRMALSLVMSILKHYWCLLVKALILIAYRVLSAFRSFRGAS